MLSLRFGKVRHVGGVAFFKAAHDGKPRIAKRRHLRSRQVSQVALYKTDVTPLILKTPKALDDVCRVVGGLDTGSC